MPSINVVMSQAVCTANLGQNTFMTGAGEPGDRIQSCAAVIFVNTGTGAAGLYHYPSGDIRTRPTAQTVIQQMVQAVAPTHAYIVYGVAGVPYVPNSVAPGDPFASNLRDFVRGQLQDDIVLKRLPARHGFASVSIADGQPVIGIEAIDPDNDIRADLAGDHVRGGLNVRVLRDAV